MNEQLEIALQQLAKVKSGKLPTNEGRKLIGKINYLKTALRIKY
jgi:hypothetical protein